MGTRWKLKKEALREAILSAPERLSQTELARHVSDHIGIDVTYDSLQAACVRHLGSNLGDLRAKVVVRAAVPTIVDPFSRPTMSVGVSSRTDAGVHPVYPPFPTVAEAIREIPGSGRDLLVFGTGDWHMPYHSKPALEVFFEAAQRIRPDVLVLMGDALDCYSLSTFSKDAKRKQNFSDELRVANGVLDIVQSIGIEKVYFLEGNHEFRLERFVRDNPQFEGVLDIRALLNIDARGWEWVPYRGESVQIGAMHFKHDVGPAGRYANQQSLDAFGNNITFGHTHRGGHELRNTVHGETFQALNTGWMGDWRQADYNHIQISRREFVTGFGSVRIDGETGHPTCAFHPIVNGQVVFEGKVILP